MKPRRSGDLEVRRLWRHGGEVWRLWRYGGGVWRSGRRVSMEERSGGVASFGDVVRSKL